MKKYYVASHGKLASGVLNSIKLIAGDLKNIEALELYPGEDPIDLAEIVEADLKSNMDNQFIVFTDLKGGSVHNAMMPLCVYENVTIISGFNLGMILDTVLLLDECNMGDLGENAVDVGKSNIELFNKTIIENIMSQASEESNIDHDITLQLNN